MLCLAIKKSNLCTCSTKSSIKTGQAPASKKKKMRIASVSQNTLPPKTLHLPLIKNDTKFNKQIEKYCIMENFQKKKMF